MDVEDPTRSKNLDSQIRTAVFSPKGDRIAASVQQNREWLVRVYDSQGERLRDFEAVRLGAENSQAFHPDGKRLLVIDDTEAHIQNIVQGDRDTLQTNGKRLAGAQFLDEDLAVTVTRDGAVWVHDLASLMPVKKLRLDLRVLNGVPSFEIRDRWILASTSSGERWLNLDEDNEAPSVSAVLRNARWLDPGRSYVAHRSSYLEVRETNAQAAALRLQMTDGARAAEHLTVDSTGQWTASCDSEATIYVWNTYSGQRREIVGHAAHITSLRFLASSRLLSSSLDGTCRIWDIRSGKERRTAKLDMPLLPNDMRFAYSNSQVAWSLNRRIQAQVVAPRGQQISPLGFGAQGTHQDEYIALRDQDTIQAWNVATETPLGALRIPGVSWSAGVVSAEGRWIAAASLKHGIWCQSASDARPRYLAEGGEIKFVPDSNHLVVSQSTRPVLQVWDLETKVLLSQTTLDSAISRITVSPDGKHLAVRTALGLELRALPLDDHRHAIEVSPSTQEQFLDNDTLLLSPLIGEGSVRIVDVKTGDETAKAEGTFRDCRVRPAPQQSVLIASPAGVTRWHYADDRIESITDLPCKSAAMSVDESMIVAVAVDGLIPQNASIHDQLANELILFNAEDYKENRRIPLTGNGRKLTRVGGKLIVETFVTGIGVVDVEQPQQDVVQLFGHGDEIILIDLTEDGRALSQCLTKWGNRVMGSRHGSRAAPRPHHQQDPRRILGRGWQMAGVGHGRRAAAGAKLARRAAGEPPSGATGRRPRNPTTAHLWREKVGVVATERWRLEEVGLASRSGGLGDSRARSQGFWRQVRKGRTAVDRASGRWRQATAHRAAARRQATADLGRCLNRRVRSTGASPMAPWPPSWGTPSGWRTAKQAPREKSITSMGSRVFPNGSPWGPAGSCC